MFTSSKTKPPVYKPENNLFEYGSYYKENPNYIEPPFPFIPETARPQTARPKTTRPQTTRPTPRPTTRPTPRTTTRPPPPETAKPTKPRPRPNP